MPLRHQGLVATLIGALRYSPQHTDGVGQLFAAVWRSGPSRCTELREATYSFVRRLKGDGLPPERVLVALKNTIARADEKQLPPSLAHPEAARDASRRRSAVYARVFAWFLEAYFAEQASSTTP